MTTNVQAPLPAVVASIPTRADGEIDLQSIVMREAIQDALGTSIRKLRRIGISVQRLTYCVVPPDPEASGAVTIIEADA